MRYMSYSNFNWIDDRLAVGGFVTESGEFPFDAILSLETHAPLTLRDVALSESLEYRWHSIIDGISYEENDAIVRRFDDAAEQIAAWLRDGKRVLVHCYMGISRSVIAVAWYLVRYEGMSWEEALDLIRVARTQANPNIRFEIPLRLAAGERLTREDVARRIDAWVEVLLEREGIAVPTEEIWETLERQGTLDRLSEPVGRSIDPM